MNIIHIQHNDILNEKNPTFTTDFKKGKFQYIIEKMDIILNSYQSLVCYASAHIYVKRSATTTNSTTHQHHLPRGIPHRTGPSRHFKIQVTTELLFCHKSSLNFLCPFFLDFHIFCVVYCTTIGAFCVCLLSLVFLLDE